MNLRRSRAMLPMQHIWITLCAAVGLMLFCVSETNAGTTIRVAAGDVQGLITAINNANSETPPYDGADIIELVASSTYTLTNVVPFVTTPSLLKGLPSISSEIEIRANGSTIQRSLNVGCPSSDEGVDDFRIFHVASTGTLTMSNVTVSAGCATDGDGGGILNEGRLQLSSGTVSQNEARFFNGGGIYNNGILILQNVTVQDNIASQSPGTSAISGGQGGGIFNHPEATLTMTESFVLNNIARIGGGIANDSSFEPIRLGRVTIERSRISGNMVAFRGGGLDNDGALVIIDSTVDNNKANGRSSGGGGVENSGDVVLINSTISNNSASGDDNSIGGGVTNFRNLIFVNVTVAGNSASRGGGIFDGEGTYAINNTVVANNPTGEDCNVELFNQGGSHNLDSDGSCGFTGPNDLPDRDPLLGPLEVNGNPLPIPTHALLPGSPAIDAGNNSNCPATDQRGVPRPQPPGGRCDIGAYELVQTVDLSIDVRGPETAGLGTTPVYTLTVTNNSRITVRNVVIQNDLPQQRFIVVPGQEAVAVRSNAQFRAELSSVSCRESAPSVVTCDLGDLPAGQQQTVTVGIAPTGAGRIESRAVVSATEADSDERNNSDSATTLILPPLQNGSACRTIPALTEFPAPADPRQAYVLIGAPFDLSATDPRDLLRSFGRVKQKAWQLFRFDADPGILPDLGEYVKFSARDSLFRFLSGRGFWFIAKNRGVLNVSGALNDTSRAFNIELQPGPAPQQISTPFNFPPDFTIDWSGCVVPTLQTLRLPVKPFLAGFTGQGQGTLGQGYSIEETMKPMLGYWVFNEAGTPVTLPIAPECVMQDTSLASSRDACVSQPATETRTVAQRPLSDIPDPKRPSALLGWRLKLSAAIGTMADTDNYLGADTVAQDELDALDYPEPPRIHGVSLSFLHPEWKAGWTHYTTDIRRLAEGKPQTWDLQVATDTRNAQVQLQWRLTGLRGVQLTLHDIDSGQVVKMSETNTYTYNTSTSKIRRFQIVQGGF